MSWPNYALILFALIPMTLSWIFLLLWVGVWARARKKKRN
jgi:hypothetical protein